VLVAALLGQGGEASERPREAEATSPAQAPGGSPEIPVTTVGRPVAIAGSPIELILPAGPIEVTSPTLEVAGRVHADVAAVAVRLEGRGQRPISSIEVPTAVVVRGVDGGVESVRAFRVSLELPTIRPNGEMTLEVRPAGTDASVHRQRVRLRVTIGPMVAPPPMTLGEDGLVGGRPFGNALGGEPRP
jgi:hypothetical protein